MTLSSAVKWKEVCSQAGIHLCPPLPSSKLLFLSPWGRCFGFCRAFKGVWMIHTAPDGLWLRKAFLQGETSGRPSASCQSGELKCSFQFGPKSWHPWISISLILSLLRRITHFLLTSCCPPAMPYPLRAFKASCYAWTITPTFWLGNGDKGRQLEGGRGSLAFYFPVLHTRLITAVFPPAW